MKSAHFPRIKANVTEQQKTAIDSLIDTMNLSEIKVILMRKGSLKTESGPEIQQVKQSFGFTAPM